MQQPIKIMIADDHAVLRRGLMAAIESTPGMKIIGEADNGEVVCKLIKKELPDIVILDIEMPILDGIQTAEILVENYPSVKIIFLTMHKNKSFLPILKKLQIKGYLLKDCAVLEILESIEQVAAGKIYISPMISDIFFEDGAIQSKSPDTKEDSILTALTATERKTLRLIALGKTNREISEEFFVSIRTVENHRFNICTKLNIKGNHSLLKFALKNKASILGEGIE